MPFKALLARIRNLIPSQQDAHYERIDQGFRDGELEYRPMTDAELGAAIGEFLEREPSAESMAGLAKRLRHRQDA